MRRKIYSIKLLSIVGLFFLFGHFLNAQNNPAHTDVKKISVLYEHQSAEYDSAVFRPFVLKLLKGFPVIANVKLIKWRSDDSFLNKSELEILNTLNIDAYYNLKFSLVAEQIHSVKASLVVKSNEDATIHKISFPEYSIDYYQSYDFLKFVKNELSGFLNSYFNLNNENDKAFSPASLKWKSLYPEAKISSSEKDYSRSNYYLNTLLKSNSSLRDSSMIKIYYLLGDNKIKQFRIDEAEEEFNKILAMDANSYWGRFGMAKVMIERNNYAGALRKADGLLPATNEVSLLKGRAYILMKQFEDAERELKSISSRSKPEIYNNKLLLLGSIYIETDQPNKAYTIYKELYSLDSTDSDIAYLYGYLVGLKGIDEYNNRNYGSAVDLLLTANEMSNNIDATDYLRLSFIHERRFDEALEFIGKKVEEGEYNTYDIYLTHALDIRIIFIDTDSTAYKDQDEFGEEMLKAINLHLTYNPDEPIAYFYKGNTLTRLGRGDEGIEQMEIAYNKNINDKSVQLDLMELYLLNDKIDACEEFYYIVKKNNKAAKLKLPDRNQAIMDYLLITSLVLQKKKYKKPYKKLKKLFKSNLILDPWSYGSYLSWLDKSNYDNASKKFLVELTNEMMKYHKKDK